MSRFLECLPTILKHEGGYVNHPSDRGGSTNKGITQKVYNTYRSSKGLELRSVEFIENSEVEDIYHEYYWIPCQADKMKAPLDLIVFDAAVNHGPNRSIKLLQKALNLKGNDVDGIWGSNTAAHLNVQQNTIAQVYILCVACLDERRKFYAKIIENDPTQKVFAKGWENRVKALEKELK